MLNSINVFSFLINAVLQEHIQISPFLKCILSFPPSHIQSKSTTQKIAFKLIYFNSMTLASTNLTAGAQ